MSTTDGIVGDDDPSEFGFDHIAFLIKNCELTMRGTTSDGTVVQYDARPITAWQMKWCLLRDPANDPGASQVIVHSQHGTMTVFWVGSAGLGSTPGTWEPQDVHDAFAAMGLTDG